MDLKGLAGYVKVSIWMRSNGLGKGTAQRKKYIYVFVNIVNPSLRYLYIVVVIAAETEAETSAISFVVDLGQFLPLAPPTLTLLL